jgi:aminoglycoside phosphotransferase family enzyme
MNAVSPSPGADVAPATKLRHLASPASYPDRPRDVTFIETHLSWVFLTERRVYKLKKPAHGEGFDFRTVAARRRNAEDELRLNRRLSPDVYVGTVPLALNSDGALVIGGPGPPVDWFVVMKRLPAERMLGRLIATNSLERAQLQQVAARLAAFFDKASSVRVSPRAYVEHFKKETESSERTIGALGSPAMHDGARRIAARVRSFMATRRALLLARVREGRIIEGHGDLRPEHICLIGAPRIIDCLEFRRDLRLLDPVDELAFLSLECARLEAPQAERVLFAAYRRPTRDRPPAELIDFYSTVRALIRARIALAHLTEPDVAEHTKWIAQAASYLAHAARRSEWLVARRTSVDRTQAASAGLGTYRNCVPRP